MFKLLGLTIQYKKQNLSYKFNLSKLVTSISGKSNFGKSTLIDIIYFLIGSSDSTCKGFNKEIALKNIDYIELFLENDDGKYHHKLFNENNKFSFEIFKDGFRVASSNKNEIFKNTVNAHGPTIKTTNGDKTYTITKYTISQYFRLNHTENIYDTTSNKIGYLPSEALGNLMIGTIKENEIEVYLKKIALQAEIKLLSKSIEFQNFYEREIAQIESQIKKYENVLEKDGVKSIDVDSIFKKIIEQQNKKEISIIKNSKLSLDVDISNNLNNFLKIVEQTKMKQEVREELLAKINYLKNISPIQKLESHAFESGIKKINDNLSLLTKGLSANEINTVSLIYSLKKQIELIRERKLELSDEAKKLPELEESLKIIDRSFKINTQSINTFNKNVNSHIKKLNGRFNLNLNYVKIESVVDAIKLDSSKNGDTGNSIISSFIYVIEWLKSLKSMQDKWFPVFISYNRTIINDNNESKNFRLAIRELVSELTDITTKMNVQLILQDKTRDFDFMNDDPNYQSEFEGINLDESEYPLRILGDFKNT